MKCSSDTTKPLLVGGFVALVGLWWWDSPAGVAMPVEGLSHGLKNIHRMFYNGLSSPACRRKLFQLCMGRAREGFSVVGLSRGLKNIHRMFFAPVCGLVPTCSSPACRRKLFQLCMGRAREGRVCPSRIKIPRRRRVPKKETPKGCLFFWCRWWDSNPHDVAINGF